MDNRVIIYLAADDSGTSAFIVRLSSPYNKTTYDDEH